MDDDSYDSKKLRKISAHLRQLKLNEYLTSRNFNLFCEAYDIDDIWNEIINGHPDQRSIGFSRLVNIYSDPVIDNFFKKFVIKTYFLKKEKFAEIIPEFLSDYSKWSHYFYDLNEPTPVDNQLIKAIGEDLLDLDFGQEDVFMYFHHAGYNLENVMDLHDRNVSPHYSTIYEMSTKKEEKNPCNRKIFIVHGHDEKIKSEVEEYIWLIGLEPIILHKQADLGKTIIEKVEHYSNVGFAIILLTEDDFGGELPSGSTNDYDRLLKYFKNPDQIHSISEKELPVLQGQFFKWIKETFSLLKPRARQNVIFEFGYFIGLLGRNHVAALCEEGLDRPSDIDGILYTPIDKNGAWKQKIAKEIDAAGITIDEKFL
jgi:predicted nucleotide-binding protein